VFINPGEAISIQNLPGIINDASDLSSTYAIAEQPALENKGVAF
jgi:hypothetical protein